MTDPVVNDVINRLVRMDTRRGLSKYQRYPRAKTAVILVDVQTGFLEAEPKLQSQLAKLLKRARTHEFAVYFSRFDANANPAFPTMGLNHMKQLLSGPKASEFPSTLSPEAADIVLPERAALSIFQGTDLKGNLQERGIEHLVLAGPLTHLSFDSSLRDAAQFDFHVSVIEDCIGLQNTVAGQDTLDLTFPRYAHEVLPLDAFDKVATQSNGIQG